MVGTSNVASSGGGTGAPSRRLRTHLPTSRNAQWHRCTWRGRVVRGGGLGPPNPSKARRPRTSARSRTHAGGAPAGQPRATETGRPPEARRRRTLCGHSGATTHAASGDASDADLQDSGANARDSRANLARRRRSRRGRGTWGGGHGPPNPAKPRRLRATPAKRARAGLRAPRKRVRPPCSRYPYPYPSKQWYLQ